MRRVEGEADFAPATAVTDGYEDVGVFDGLAVVCESGEEGEEVAGGGVGEDEPEGHVVVEEFEGDLRGAVFAEKAGSARASFSQGLNAVEATTRWFLVLVEGPGMMEAEQQDRQGLE
jgi:hypothetical protein